VPHAGTDSARRAVIGAISDLTEGRVRTAAELRACLDLIELLPYRDVPAAVEPARIAAQLAAELGDQQLQAQAQLIQADILARQGKAAESGRLLFETSEWAKNDGTPHVLARSHYLTAMFYRLVGDPPSALEHALHALESTPDDVLPELRAEHMLGVALTFDEAGNAEEAARRYAEVVDVGLRIGHPRLSINGLNNMAYVHCEEGHPELAVPLVARMSEIAAEYGSVLNARHRDTAATVQLMLGEPQTALEMLHTLLFPGPGDLPVEPEPLAQCLLTAAQAHRALGQLEDAKTTLDRLQELCTEQQLNAVMVQSRLERAQLHAAAGAYREAYEEHRAFHAASEALRSSESESRARILHIVLGAQQARRDSDHFRELALRDSLTGLHNRRFINDHLTELLERGCRSGQPLSVAMLDLDHFKRINDTLSHDAGDDVLVAFSTLLADNAEAPAVAARLGGEEFLVILPQTGETEARAWTRKMLAVIRSHDWSPLAGDLPVTVSAGLVTARGPGWTREQLLRAADKNLYAAKDAGRDRFIGPT
jgi:diguanylate cyclase (GGDEF)-like protein